MAAIHETRKKDVVDAVLMINYLAKLGTITDSNINSITTGVAGLKGLITTTKEGERIPMFRNAIEKIVLMKNLGLLTDSNVNSATSVSDLRGLLTGVLSATDLDPFTKYDGSQTYSGNVGTETAIG